LAKISPVDFEITGLPGIDKNKQIKTEAKHIACHAFSALILLAGRLSKLSYSYDAVTYINKQKK